MIIYDQGYSGMLEPYDDDPRGCGWNVCCGVTHWLDEHGYSYPPLEERTDVE